MAICTPRSAAASPRSRTITSDNGTGTSFLQRQRSTGVLAASGVAPPPSGQGKGAAAGASPARASGTRIGKLQQQQQQDDASPRPRPPAGVASGDATTPRRVWLSLAQVPVDIGDDRDFDGLGVGLGGEAADGVSALTARSKTSSRPSLNGTKRPSLNGTNRTSLNGTNRTSQNGIGTSRLSYNGSARLSLNRARSFAFSAYGDSSVSSHEDDYKDDGVDIDACSHVSRAASRNSRTSFRSRATTAFLGAFSDVDTDEDGSWTPRQAP